MTLNFILTLTEDERRQMAIACSLMVQKLSLVAPVIEDRTETKSVPQAAQPPIHAQSPAAAPHLTTGTGELRDRWASDRKGNEQPNPEGCEPIDVHIWKTKQAEKWLQVTWQNAGTGYGDAKCFDQKLWPWIIARTGKSTRLYIVRKGQYLNVVGVCA